MKRREFLIRAATCGAVTLAGRVAWAGRAAQRGPAAAYSEAATLSAASSDGLQSLSMRLERFPARERGALHLVVCLGPDTYAVAAGDLDLGGPPTPTAIDEPRVSFEIGGSLVSEVARTIDGDVLSGTVHVSALAHPVAAPPSGAGASPLRIEGTFRSGRPPLAAREGRRDAIGELRVEVRTLQGAHELQAFGTWSEEVGDALTSDAPVRSLRIAGADSGLIAVERRSGVFGCAWDPLVVRMLRAFDIEPRDGQSRKFRAVLDDGRIIEGTTEPRRESVLPADARRSLESTIVATTTFGPMAGHLTDWED